MATWAVCGCGIVLAPSLWERPHTACCTTSGGAKAAPLGFPVPCWRVKHLCSSCSCVCLVLQKYFCRSLFFEWKNIRTGNAGIYSRGARTRILCWLQQEGGKHCLCHPWPFACSSCSDKPKAGFISGLMVPETTAFNFTVSDLGLCGAE